MPWWCDEHEQHSIDEVCPGCEREKQMSEWKYKTLKLEEPIHEDHLARMGRQGWELAGCTTHEAYARPIGRDKVTKHIYYFKQARKLKSS